MAEKNQNNGGAAEKNRFRKLFESIHFSVSDSDQVYENERRRQKSRKVANVVIMLAGGAASTPGYIWARQIAGQKPILDFVFLSAAMGRNQAIIPVDETAKAELAEWKRYALAEYKAWRAKPENTAPKPAASQVDADDLGELFG